MIQNFHCNVASLSPSARTIQKLNITAQYEITGGRSHRNQTAKETYFVLVECQGMQLTEVWETNAVI